jgi:peptidyl-tRNA hydrolase, PTH1 family
MIEKPPALKGWRKLLAMLSLPSLVPPVEPENAPYLIVGLGNPGRDYRNTRHNLGFMVIDALGKALSISLTRSQSRALVGSGSLEGRRVILAKPITFMNLSGQSVSGLVKFYKVPLGNLLVVHDELDLPLGSLRLRPDGGSAGNKGMVSIIDRLGTPVFPRMRVGIGRPPGKMDPVDFVLQQFTKAEQELLSQVLERAAKAASTFVASGLETAMNQFNGLIKE